MKSIQIGRLRLHRSRRCRAASSRRSRPNADRDVRVESDEPRIAVFVHRPGLARERPVGRRSACACPCWTTPRSRFVMTKAVSARSASCGSGRFLEQDVALAIGDRHHRRRLETDALFGNAVQALVISTSVALPHRERATDTADSRLQTEPLGIRHDVFRTDLRHRLHRRNVARLFERSPQSDESFVLAVVVQRLVGRLIRPGLVGDRFVDERRNRREAPVDGRGEDERLNNEPT